MSIVILNMLAVRLKILSVTEGRKYSKLKAGTKSDRRPQNVELRHKINSLIMYGFTQNIDRDANAENWRSHVRTVTANNTSTRATMPGMMVRGNVDVNLLKQSNVYDVV